jgi:hypothetical protein
MTDPKTIGDAIMPPSEHPTLGTMRMNQATGWWINNEMSITGDTKGMFERLKKLIEKERFESEIVQINADRFVYELYSHKATPYYYAIIKALLEKILRYEKDYGESPDMPNLKNTRKKLLEQIKYHEKQEINPNHEKPEEL